MIKNDTLPVKEILGDPTVIVRELDKIISGEQ